MTNNEKDNQLPVEEVKIDLDKIKMLIPTYSSEKLCEMIVADRYLGISSEVSVMCMEELANRRIAGDTFQFEKYIDETFKSLPVLNFAMPDLRAILTQLTKQGKK
jgi:3-oxoacyl-[acyl-carrier-protein] synthase III